MVTDHLGQPGSDSLDLARQLGKALLHVQHRLGQRHAFVATGKPHATHLLSSDDRFDDMPGVVGENDHRPNGPGCDPIRDDLEVPGQRLVQLSAQLTEQGGVPGVQGHGHRVVGTDVSQAGHERKQPPQGIEVTWQRLCFPVQLVSPQHQLFDLRADLLDLAQHIGCRHVRNATIGHRRDNRGNQRQHRFEPGPQESHLLQLPEVVVVDRHRGQPHAGVLGDIDQVDHPESLQGGDGGIETPTVPDHMDLGHRNLHLTTPVPREPPEPAAPLLRPAPACMPTPLPGTGPPHPGS